MPSDDAVVFIHTMAPLDSKRKDKDELLNIYKDHVRYQMALAFMLAHPYGIPVVFSSYKLEDINGGRIHCNVLFYKEFQKNKSKI